jgi:hypothetical protein
VEMKRIGQFEVDSGRVLIVDSAYVAEPQVGLTWAAVRMGATGIYPVYQFEHEGTTYTAFPTKPGAAAKTLEGALGFALDRLQGAREQAGENHEQPPCPASAHEKTPHLP